MIPKARGSLSQHVLDAISAGDDAGRVAIDHSVAPEHEDDLQITLWVLYELHYRGFDHVDEALEWHPELLRLRHRLETTFERDLRARFPVPQLADPLGDALLRYVDAHDGPSLAAHVQRRADREQVLQLLQMRSVYHLKESDPVAWVVPRLPVGPQAALMELQFDEYGDGDPARLHRRLFAQGLADCGVPVADGPCVDEAPVEVLEQNNAMSLFGLHRRLRGAALGHLAAFEATSSLPSRRMAQGIRRVGLPESMAAYYDEHVEADAVHEQLAARGVCQALVEAEPSTRDDVAFGVAVCLGLEDALARTVLARWAA